MGKIVLRVAYVLPSLQKPGGWRTHSRAFLGHICTHVQPVLHLAQADEAQARQLFPDLELNFLPSTQGAAWNALRNWPRLWAAWRAARSQAESGVELVHSLEAYPTGLVGSWLAAGWRVPHVLTSHGTYGVIWHRHPLDRLAYQNVLRRASAVCPVSTGTARLMEQHFGPALAHTRLVPILNGSQAAQAYPRQAALQRALPTVPTLLSVGDVKPRKGYHLSLAAFGLVQAEYPQARYWIVGSYQRNPYFQRLQKMIADLGLKNVEFIGVVNEGELRSYYEGASLFVLTPVMDGLRFEGFGLVYLEAGAYGLPVVATRTGGVPDAVREGLTGLLAEPGDIAGIAGAILRLLDKPELAQDLGRHNREWAETLTWERNAAATYQLYTEILGKR